MEGKSVHLKRGGLTGGSLASYGLISMLDYYTERCVAC